MNTVAVLARRNLRLFFRDHAGVFFSLLSALIVILLYALFLGRVQVDNFKQRAPTVAHHDAIWFVDTWVFAGITMITTMTTALASLGAFVDDRATGRFRDFGVSPVRRTHLILGYLVSSLIVSVTMSVIVLAVSQRYLIVPGLGTMIGFFAGAYIPIGALPAGVAEFMNCLPFTQAAMLLRGPFTAKALAALTAEPQWQEAAKRFFGVTAWVGDTQITSTIAVVTLLTALLLFTGLAAWRLARRVR